MATMITTAKNAFFNIARKSQNYPRKASTVRFTTTYNASSKHNEDYSTSSAKESFKENMEGAKDKAEGTKEMAKERAGEAKERAKGAAEKTKEKAGEAAQSLGEKAKQKVQEAWGAAKETSHKVKETVVGKGGDDDDDVDKLVEDRTKKNKLGEHDMKGD